MLQLLPPQLRLLTRPHAEEKKIVAEDTDKKKNVVGVNKKIDAEEKKNGVGVNRKIDAEEKKNGGKEKLRHKSAA